MEIEIRLESRLHFLTFYAWPRKYKNEALRFQNQIFKLEYCNNCVHEKMPHGLKTILKWSHDSHVYCLSILSLIEFYLRFSPCFKY